MPNPAGLNWKGRTVRDIAEQSGFAPAAVDSALNGRPGVRDATRVRILAAHRKLSRGPGAVVPLRIRLISQVVGIQQFCRPPVTNNVGLHPFLQ